MGHQQAPQLIRWGGDVIGIKYSDITQRQPCTADFSSI